MTERSDPKTPLTQITQGASTDFQSGISTNPSSIQGSLPNSAGRPSNYNPMSLAAMLLHAPGANSNT
jgi:hypothetical protein